MWGAARAGTGALGRALRGVVALPRAVSVRLWEALGPRGLLGVGETLRKRLVVGAGSPTALGESLR